MRDLELIQERPPEGDGRPLALVGLLLVVTVGLILSLGLWVGAGDEDAAEDDPLARLDPNLGLVAEPSTAAPADEDDGALPSVDPADLTFPEALTPEEERPEVAAALAAAAAELAHPDPLDESPLPPTLPADVAAPPPQAPPPPEEPLPTPEELEATLPASLPAAMAAGPAREHLVDTAARDPLVAAALPEPPATPPAEEGSDGPYTVQVISYDTVESAEAFAAGLRARGHRAFVVHAEIEGRGAVWRVRIGPFRTLGDAQRYRQDFEEREGMNTLVVRRRDPA
ncbi:MAG: SPOR domain-containing protein [Sandaracinaceae bacterium]